MPKNEDSAEEEEKVGWAEGGGFVSFPNRWTRCRTRFSRGGCFRMSFSSLFFGGGVQGVPEISRGLNGELRWEILRGGLEGLRGGSLKGFPPVFRSLPRLPGDLH